MNDKQVAEGKLTYSGLLIAALSVVLTASGLVPLGLDVTTVATSLVGLGLAAYGRWRREKR